MKADEGSNAIKLWKELERLSRVLGEVGPDEVCCEGLTPRQTTILKTLAAGEGARICDLAEQAGITPSAMTRVLEKLEALDMVERVRGAQADGRAAMVRITANGRRTRAAIDKLMVNRAEDILSAIPATQCPTVLRCLSLLCEALEKTGCCSPNAAKPLYSIETK